MRKSNTNSVKRNAAKQQVNNAAKVYGLSLSEAVAQIRKAISEKTIKVSYPKGKDLVYLGGSGTWSINKAVGVVANCKYSTLWNAANHRYEVPRKAWDKASNESDAKNPKNAKRSVSVVHYGESEDEYCMGQIASPKESNSLDEIRAWIRRELAKSSEKQKESKPKTSAKQKEVKATPTPSAKQNSEISKPKAITYGLAMASAKKGKFCTAIYCNGLMTVADFTSAWVYDVTSWSEQQIGKFVAEVSETDGGATLVAKPKASKAGRKARLNIAK